MSSAIQEDRSCLFTFYTPGTSNMYTIKLIKVSLTEYLLFYNGLHSEKLQSIELTCQKLFQVFNTLINQHQRIKIDLFSPYQLTDFACSDFKDFFSKKVISLDFYVNMLG